MNQFISKALREGLGHEGGESFSVPKHVKDNKIERAEGFPPELHSQKGAMGLRPEGGGQSEAVAELNVSSEVVCPSLPSPLPCLYTS